MGQALGEGNFYWNLGQALDVNAKDGGLLNNLQQNIRNRKHRERIGKGGEGYLVI
jgi:hypothetical protein